MALRITLGNLLHECAEKFAKRQFLVIAETGETLTYHEFEILIMALNESATSLVKFATTLAEGKDLQAYAESC